MLDTLFFDFIGLAKKLQPKVVIAENVKGLLMGNAKAYVRRIYDAFSEAGYYLQHFLLNGMTMGLPQKRERVFFIALRKDIAVPFLKQKDLFFSAPHLDMTFHEEPIIFDMVRDDKGRHIPEGMYKYWKLRKGTDTSIGDIVKRLENRLTMFNQSFIRLSDVCGTLRGKEDCCVRFDQPTYLSKTEFCKISSFPTDYDFTGLSPWFISGMAVPPVMMAQIATRVWEYWLSKI